MDGQWTLHNAYKAVPVSAQRKDHGKARPRHVACFHNPLCLPKIFCEEPLDPQQIGQELCYGAEYVALKDCFTLIKVIISDVKSSTILKVNTIV